MHIGTPKQLLALCGVLVALGVGAELRARSLEDQAQELAARSQQAGAAFSTSLVGQHMETELRLLDERRDLMLQSSGWRRAALLGVGLSLLAAFAAFVSHELRVFRAAIEGADAGRS